MHLKGDWIGLDSGYDLMAEKSPGDLNAQHLLSLAHRTLLREDKSLLDFGGARQGYKAGPGVGTGKRGQRDGRRQGAWSGGRRLPQGAGARAKAGRQGSSILAGEDWFLPVKMAAGKSIENHYLLLP